VDDCVISSRKLLIVVSFFKRLSSQLNYLTLSSPPLGVAIVTDLTTITTGFNSTQHRRRGVDDSILSYRKSLIDVSFFFIHVLFN